MSEKIKVGNVEVDKANYDYFSLLYSKMPKEYVVADLVSKCEDYYRLFSSYQDLEFKLQQKENVIAEAINCIKKEGWFCYKDNEEVIDRIPVNKLLEILVDKENK